MSERSLVDQRARWLVMRSLGAGLGLGAFVVVATSCGSAGLTPEETPVAALGSSREAQTEFLALTRRWSRASRAERVAMEPELRAFRLKFPSDDLGRMIDALLGWAALESGDLDRAEAISKAVEAKGAGAARDIALVVEGAALRRRGKPEAALAKLTPIVSKIVDSWVRALLNEEAVTAALSARRWTKAVELMDVWLREADVEEHGGVRGRIEQLMPQVPPEELTRILDARLGRGAAEAPSEDELDMRRILAQELARVARARRDVKLAQHLMATSGPLLGQQGDAVAQLAAGSGKARVDAPTVGLLLSTRSDEARRHSAEVAAGVMHGLGIPGSSARIVSRDDSDPGSDPQETMNALTADGAAILIAGIDEPSAEEAAGFAQARGIPVVLLRPPSALQPSGFVFILGPGPGPIREVLATGLGERGAGHVALVTRRGPPKAISPDATERPVEGPKTTTTLGCGAAVDLAAWKGLDVNGVLLDGDAECSRAVVAAASALRPVRFAFGFEAIPSGVPAGSLAATAGLFPIVARTTEDSRIASWLSLKRSPPSFWSALGRDAAVLAWAGVQALPTQGTEDPKEVQARRLAARDALARATADLWTTEARGFDGARMLARRIGVTELTGSGR